MTNFQNFLIIELNKTNYRMMFFYCIISIIHSILKNCIKLLTIRWTANKKRVCLMLLVFIKFFETNFFKKPKVWCNIIVKDLTDLFKVIFFFLRNYFFSIGTVFSVIIFSCQISNNIAATICWSVIAYIWLTIANLIEVFNHRKNLIVYTKLVYFNFKKLPLFLKPFSFFFQIRLLLILFFFKSNRCIPIWFTLLAIYTLDLCHLFFVKKSFMLLYVIDYKNFIVVFFLFKILKLWQFFKFTIPLKATIFWLGAEFCAQKCFSENLTSLNYFVERNFIVVFNIVFLYTIVNWNSWFLISENLIFLSL